MKKRFLGALLAAVMLISVTSVFSVVSSAETTVTDWDANVITLNTADDFKAFHDKIVNKTTFANQTVKLGADINVKGYSFTNITAADQQFLGTFDGQYHTVSGITATLEAYRGFFGSVGEGVTTGGFKNLAITDSTFSTWSACGIFYGNLHGSTTFENVYLNVSTVNGAGGAMGGFIGRMSSATATVSFKNCVFDGAMTTKNGANGGAYSYAPFVGSLENAATVSFENCLIYGDFTRKEDAANIWAGAGKFINTVGANCAAQISYEDCIQFNEYYQYTSAGRAYAVCPEWTAIGTGATAKTPAGFTARNAGYPVPTTLLCYFPNDPSAAKFVEFRDAEGTLVSRNEFDGDTYTVTELPTVEGADMTKMLWKNVGSGAIIEEGTVLTESAIILLTEIRTKQNEVLGIQLGNTVGGKQNIRFIGGVFFAESACLGVGFEITVKYADENGDIVERYYETTLKTVYTSINATVDGDIKNVTAKELGANYLFALVLEDVPTTEGQLDFTVTTFKAYGAKMLRYYDDSTVTFSVLDGAVDNTLSPLS